MKRIFVFIFLTIFLLDSAYSMSWPFVSAVLIRNFGSNDRGRPVLGMVFSGNTEVIAAESGEVIFSRGRESAASRLPSPFGAWTALDHGDGLISIYSRYADTQVLETRIERQQPIASSGASGWTSQDGFYFLVYDRRERRWINPVMIITPHLDTRAPQILSVQMRNAQGNPVQAGNLSQGRYTVTVTTNTPAAPRGYFFAPLRIICLINGAETGSLNFESISAKDGVLMVYRNGLFPASQVYSNFPAFETADVFLSRGQANMEIIVQDIAGNSRSVFNRMVVN